MDAYHVLERIGEGSFGKVFKGRRKYTGQFVALKFISKSGKSEADLAALRQEIAILRQLDHENIILLLDFFETKKDIVVVTEYAHGELLNILQDDTSLPESTVAQIARQLASALSYLHYHHVIHRDIKPQNILLSSNGIIKLADFGFARSFSTSVYFLTSIKGTPLYMSPEMLNDKAYGPKADLWGLGVLLYELATGIPPFYASNIQQLMKLIINPYTPIQYPSSMSNSLVSFLQLLLVREPHLRANWETILQHPFIIHPHNSSTTSTSASEPHTDSQCIEDHQSTVTNTL